MNEIRPSFAYLFERFPSFVQTFCYREVEEMLHQHMEPLVVSIRRPDDPAELNAELTEQVTYLPEEKALRAEVDRQRNANELDRAVRRAIPKHRAEKDSQRLFEAAWLGPVLKKKGIRHVHAHFGGMAARTAWWLRELYGIDYSFTGHANDIFCDTDYPVSNTDLVAGARFVVTETDFARAWMENKYPAARGKIFRVFNGIALEGFEPRLLEGERPRILSVGRLVEKKGFTHLIEACRQLCARGRELECLIIGDGPLQPELQEQIARARLEGVVQLLGPRPQTEVRRYLAGAHVFALACVPEEDGGSDNLPTVIMEAMAAGVPVVSTRLAGIPEMITDGVEGLLVQPGDAEALGQALDRVLTNAETTRRMGEQGQQTAHSKFSIASTTRSLKHILATHGDVRVPEAARLVDPLLPGRAGLLRRLFGR